MIQKDLNEEFNSVTADILGYWGSVYEINMQKVIKKYVYLFQPSLKLFNDKI